MTFLRRVIDKPPHLVYNELGRAHCMCYCGSMVEQIIRNDQVVSSILTSSSMKNPAQLLD